MDFQQLAAARRSIRDFAGTPVPNELVAQLLEAAHWAPSAGNLQPWRFFVIKSKEVQREICEKCYPAPWIKKAPLLIVVAVDQFKSSWRYHERGAELYCLQDTAAAIQNLLLCAESLGLGACWVGAFSEESCSEILHLQKDVRPVAILPIGYAVEKPAGPGREPLEHSVTWIE